VPHVNPEKNQNIHVYHDSCALKVYEKVVTDTFGFREFNHEGLSKRPKCKAPKRPLFELTL
jgi:hypothetical protein